MRRSVLIVGAAVGWLGTACVSYQTAAGPAVERFQPLWERKLTTFQHGLTVEHHWGTEDAFTDVGDAWVALADCEDVAPAPPNAGSDRVAALLYASLVAEDSRRRLRIAEAAAQRRRLEDDTFLTALRSPDWFDRSVEPLDESLVKWPAEREGWLDEVPAAQPSVSKCDGYVARVLSQPRDPEEVEGPPRTLEDYREAYANAAVAVRDAGRGLDGVHAVLVWRTALHAAARAHAERRALEERNSGGALTADAAGPAAKRAALLDGRVRGWLDTLRTAPAGVDPHEAARALLLEAHYAQADGDLTRVEALARRALELAPEDDNAWGARYLLLKLQADNAAWAAAADGPDVLPPPASPYFASYAYWRGVALRRVGEEDRFLGHAMAAFRDRPFEASPHLRALYYDAIGALAEYPFEPRITEMLENMGPREQTYERIEEFARMALLRGHPENAETAAVWLLAKHSNVKYHPTYEAIRAMSAFAEDDDTRFRKAIRRITRRNEEVADALSTGRQASFYAHADEELARVFRQMLPMMAEWGDDKEARDRRQKWLRVMVDEAQVFLRETESTLARPSLVELYRLASALLADHPRGYAERVGVSEPPPLVLGMVEVGGANLEAHEPAFDVAFDEPWALTLIPRGDLPPQEWTFEWGAETASLEGPK